MNELFHAQMSTDRLLNPISCYNKRYTTHSTCCREMFFIHKVLSGIISPKFESMQSFIR